MNKRILLATNGRSESEGAVRLAHLLREEDGAEVEALAVVEPSSLLISAPPEAIVPVAPAITSAMSEALEARVLRQMDTLGLDSASSPLMMRTGEVAPTIADRAREGNFDLVLTGLSATTHPGAYFSREMLVRLVHLSAVPIVGVSPRFRTFGVAIAAIDFTTLSTRALEELCDLLRPGSILHLVHVLSGETRGVPGSASKREESDARLSRLATSIATDSKLVTNHHVVAGDPATEILRLAQDLRADVVAAGSEGAGLLRRVLLGGVAARLLHGASCSVLIAPPTLGEEIGLELTDEELLENLGRAGGLLRPVDDNSPAG